MKSVLLSDNFKKAISLVERSTSKDLTLPILGSFLITIEGGAIRVTGTNLEIGIETLLRGTVQEPGKIAIPAKTLSLFISSLPKEEKVTLESKGNDLYIYTQLQKTLFKGYAPEDFPPFPKVKELYSVVFKKQDLIRAISKSLVSVSRSALKPELSSVNFLFEKDIATLSSTDSFRLSEEKVKPVSLSSKVSKESFLIPLRTCEEFIKLSEYSSEGEVIFEVGQGEVLIQYKDVELYSRLTEGNFPEYQQIIPKKFATSAVLQKSAIMGHLRRASIFADKLRGISLSIDPNKKTCTIESVNRDIGEYNATFNIEGEGEPLKIVFNYHYLIEGVESFNDETLFFGFNGESQPLLIHPPERAASLYIVMPMRSGL